MFDDKIVKRPSNWIARMFAKINSTFINGENSMELTLRLGGKTTFEIPESCENREEVEARLPDNLLVRAIVVGLNENYLGTAFKIVQITDESFVYMNLATKGLTKYIKFEDYQFVKDTNRLHFIKSI